MPYADPLDPTTPADNDVVSFGDDRIREFKRGLIQRLSTVFTNTDSDPLVFLAGIVPGAAVAALGIGTAQIALQAVTAAQILNATITAAQIAASTIVASNLAAGAVDNVALGVNAVSTSNIIDAAITDSKISAVSGTKVNSGTLPGTAIAAGGVGTAQLGAGAVSTANVAALAITSALLANGAVGNTQLAATSVDTSNLTGALKNLLMIGKSVSIAVASTAIGTRSVVTFGATALTGAASGDVVVLGLPPEWLAFTDVGQLGLMIPYAMASLNNVTLRVTNNNDGPFTIPACTFQATVIKSATAWGY